MDYLSVEEGRQRGGLRLVLTVGVPGPWGEAAKGILRVKGITYAPVCQMPAGENSELEAWTGRNNAPVAVYEDERPRDGWAEILLLAERLAPEPRLLPDEPEERALMFGLSHEICGEDGFGWSRRLMLLHPTLKEGPGHRGYEAGIAFGSKYGYTREAGEAAAGRAAEVLRMLSTRLREQRDQGSRYFVGHRLSAADIHWATFAALFSPLSEELCAMPAYLRAGYECKDPTVLEAADPILLEHRDFMYEEHLELPLDF